MNIRQKRASAVILAISAVAGGLWLGPGAALATSAGSAGDARQAESIVGDIFSPAQRANIEFSNAFEPLIVEFADVYAGRGFDEKSIVTVVGYNETASVGRVNAFREAVEGIPVIDSFTVSLEARDFSMKQRQDLAEELRVNPAALIALLGSEVTGSEFDPATGLLYVSLAGAVTEGAVFEGPNGTPIVTTGRQASVEFQPSK